jgi:hypothetical protein
MGGRDGRGTGGVGRAPRGMRGRADPRRPGIQREGNAPEGSSRRLEGDRSARSRGRGGDRLRSAHDVPLVGRCRRGRPRFVGPQPAACAGGVVDGLEREQNARAGHDHRVRLPAGRRQSLGPGRRRRCRSERRALCHRRHGRSCLPPRPTRHSAVNDLEITLRQSGAVLAMPFAWRLSKASAEDGKAAKARWMRPGWVSQTSSE